MYTGAGFQRELLPEVVGDAAILVNPENVFDIARGMKASLLNDKLRADLVVRGRAQAASFSWKYAAEQVIRIYARSGEAMTERPAPVASYIESNVHCLLPWRGHSPLTTQPARPRTTDDRFLSSVVCNVCDAGCFLTLSERQSR